MTIREILSDYPRWCMCDQDECQDSQNFKEAIAKLELAQNKARLDELKHLTDDDGIWYQDMARQFPQKITLNQRIKEFEQSLLKALEEN